MRAMFLRLSVFSFLSLGTKVLIGVLLWRGMPLSWASIISALVLMPFAIKLFRECVTQKYRCDFEAQAERLREDEITWVSIVPNREAYIKGSRVASPPVRSSSTRGPSSAPKPAASSASVRAVKIMRFVFRPHTPALITTVSPQSDGASQ